MRAALLICDQVVERDGQKDVLGVKGIFSLQRIPTKGRFTVFALVDQLSPGPHQVAIAFESASGKRLAEYAQSVRIEREFMGRLWYTYEAHATIESQGDYIIRYHVDGNEIGALPFSVELAVSPP